MATTTSVLTTTTGAMSNESGSSNETLTQGVEYESLPPRMAFLSLFIATALMGNTFIVVVVLQSPVRRRSSLHIIILNLSAVCLVDSLLNMPVVLGALVTNSWTFGEVVCRCNAFLMNLVLIETILTLLLLAVERFVAVKAQADYDRAFTRVRVSLMVAYTWLHSAAFSIPLLAGAVSSTFNAQVHLCVISGWSSLIFVCLTSVLCFLVPILATVVLHILTVRATHAQRFAVRTILAQNHYSEKLASPPRILQDSFMAKYAGFLFLIWLLMDLPYIVTTYIQQYQYSSEFQANPSLGPVEYPWVVDVTLTWTRFAFSAVAPAFTLCWSKEYWQAVKDAVLCRRNNSIVDIQAPRKSGKARSRDKKTVLGGTETKRNDGQNLTFSVPVLFATANGIHIQTSEPETESQAALDDDTDHAEFQARDVPALGRLRGRKCDVVGLPADYLAADTSDYDSSSEVDPYSSSQPISARDVVRPPDVQRSSSQPEVKRDRGDPRPDSGRKRLLQLCGTDSGLDLSGATSTTLLSKQSGTSGSVRLVQETSKDLRRSQMPFDGPDRDDRGPKDSVHIEVVGSPLCERAGSGLVCACERETCSSECISVDETDSRRKSDGSDTHESRDREGRKSRCADTTSKQEVLAVAEINATQILSTQKPPIRLKPLESPSRLSTRSKRDKSPKKQTRSSKLENRDSSKAPPQTPSQKDGEKTSRKPSRKRSHKRQGTADSQKALMGSGSSSELHDLKAQCSEGGVPPSPDPLPSAQLSKPVGQPS